MVRKLFCLICNLLPATDYCCHTRDLRPPPRDAQHKSTQNSSRDYDIERAADIVSHQIATQQGHRPGNQRKYRGCNSHYPALLLVTDTGGIQAEKSGVGDAKYKIENKHRDEAEDRNRRCDKSDSTQGPYQEVGTEYRFLVNALLHRGNQKGTGKCQGYANGQHHHAAPERRSRSGW